MSERHDCPACGSGAVSPLYRVDGIPVQSCILLDTEEEARAFPRADLALAFCDDCGFIYNALFDLSLVDYAATTEESQHFSGTFNRFAETLVDEIAGTYPLAGKTTLEIGCGKGDFLEALARRTGTAATGVDPGFIPDRQVNGAAAIRFRKEYFDPFAIDETPDLVVCRHTLEHIPDVGAFMGDVATVLDAGGDSALFFETPDVGRVLSEGAFWDIYYEHCSYFTLGSHARLFRAHGMDVTKLYLAYGGQYIIQYADNRPGPARLPEEQDLDTLRRMAAAFPETIARTRAHWRDFVTTRHRYGRKVAIWGGGSKGVSFLTTNDLGEEVSSVIDINPFKQGKYLPGTGHEVIGPEALAVDPPDTVIVMNGIYLPEIGAQLAGMGLKPELVAL